MRLRHWGPVAAVAAGVLSSWGPAAHARLQPVRGRLGMVATQNAIASQVGVEVLWDGGNAIDAAVASAFALAVTHPTAGNIGGGGFIVYRPAQGEPVAYDFREVAPAAASPTMFLVDGRYDRHRHHDSHVSVGVPGSVAGLHMAWKAHGKLPWKRLVYPAVYLARDGFMVTENFSRSLKGALQEMKERKYEASVAQFSRGGTPYEMGDRLRQPDLARTLRSVQADQGFAILLVEHDVEFVADFTQRAYVLDFGVMIAEGPTAEVLQSDVVRQAYLGDIEAAS